MTKSCGCLQDYLTLNRLVISSFHNRAIPARFVIIPHHQSGISPRLRCEGRSLYGSWPPKLSSAINLLAGLLAGKVTGNATTGMPARFMQVVVIVVITGVMLWPCARPIQKLMPGVK